MNNIDTSKGGKDLISQTQELWGNEKELKLHTKLTRKNFDLYKENPKEDDFVRAILDAKGKKDTADIDDIKKARSHARHVANYLKSMAPEAKTFETMNLKERVQQFGDMKEDQRKELLNEIVQLYLNLGTELKGKGIKELFDYIKNFKENAVNKEQTHETAEKHNKLNLENLEKKLLEELQKSDTKHAEEISDRDQELQDTEIELKSTKDKLAEEQRGKIKIDSKLKYDSTAIGSLKTGIVQADKLKEGVSIKLLSWSGRRNRKRLNRMIGNMNNIQDDYTKGVQHMFSMTRFWKGGKVRGSFRKRLLKRRGEKGKTRKAKDFIEIFKEQRNMFVEKAGELLEHRKDTNTLKQIENRVDWRIKKYADNEASQRANVTK